MTPQEFQRLRVKYDVSIIELAHKAVIDEYDIMDFEHGKTELSPEIVEKLVNLIKRIGER